MLEFNIGPFDHSTKEGRDRVRTIFDLMDAGWPIVVAESRVEVALAEPRSMLAELALPRPEDLPEGADPFDPAPDDFPPPSAGPSTADPGVDPLPPLAHQEGPAEGGDMGIAISEPEICETGENYSDPIPWPVAATPETGIPVSDGGDFPPEELGSAPEQAAEITEEQAPEGVVTAPEELGSEPSVPSNTEDLCIAPQDTQGVTGLSRKSVSPAPEFEGAERGVEPEVDTPAPPAANIEPEAEPSVKPTAAKRTRGKIKGVNSSTEKAPVSKENDNPRTGSVNFGAESSTKTRGDDLPVAGAEADPPDDALEAAVSEPEPQPLVMTSPPPEPRRIVPPEPKPVAVERRPQDFSDGGRWTAQEELTVLRLYGQGRNAYAISQQLKGRSSADIVTRFRKLVPHPGSANQARALKAAEERVAAERRAAE